MKSQNNHQAKEAKKWVLNGPSKIMGLAKFSSTFRFFLNTCIEVSISQFKKVTIVSKNASLDFWQSLVLTTQHPCNLNF